MKINKIGRDAETEKIENRIRKAKTAYSTRRVNLSACRSLQVKAIPKSGDLVLARVMEIGRQTRLQLTSGRRAHIFPGDEIIVAYGNRYAPDQYEGTVPKSLAPCHLVAAGGLASRLRSKSTNIKPPTIIEPIALLGDKTGRIMNLNQFSLKRQETAKKRPLTIAVAGTSMNSGKTTTAACLIKGLTAYGLKVGAAKLTGTGAGGDPWLFADSGAAKVLDFIDAGHPSTYLIPFEQIEETVTLLTDELTNAGVDVMILEIADGLYQQETAQLLTSKLLCQKVDGLIFAAGEALGATAGVEWMQRKSDIPLIAVSGALTAAPLASREVEEIINLPVLGKRALSRPAVINYLKKWFPQAMQEIGVINPSLAAVA